MFEISKRSKKPLPETLLSECRTQTEVGWKDGEPYMEMEDKSPKEETDENIR